MDLFIRSLAEGSGANIVRAKLIVLHGNLRSELYVGRGASIKLGVEGIRLNFIDLCI